MSSNLTTLDQSEPDFNTTRMFKANLFTLLKAGTSKQVA